MRHRLGRHVRPAKRLRARLGSGALEADEGLRRGAHPKFKVTVRDAEGKRTRLPSAAARRAGSEQPARIAPGPASIPVEG